MPFKSPKQERYLWARHPAIAKRWAAEYGSYEHPKLGQKHPANPESQSGEVNRPGVSRVKRHTGADDFRHLTPSASARFAPSSAPRPNQQESDREGPVAYVPGSRGRELRRAAIKQRSRHG